MFYEIFNIQLLVMTPSAPRSHPEKLEKLETVFTSFSQSLGNLLFFSQGGEAYLFSYGVSEFSQGRSDFLAVGKLLDFSGCDAILRVKMNDMSRNRTV